MVQCVFNSLPAVANLSQPDFTSLADSPIFLLASEDAATMASDVFFIWSCAAFFALSTFSAATSAVVFSFGSNKEPTLSPIDLTVSVNINLNLNVFLHHFFCRVLMCRNRLRKNCHFAQAKVEWDKQNNHKILLRIYKSSGCYNLHNKKSTKIDIMFLNLKYQRYFKNIKFARYSHF